MPDPKTKQFFRLFMSVQNQIYAYILVCVLNATDADDIMQETAATMWQKFDVFTIGTDFHKWGRVIAYYKIKDYRKKRRNSRIHFTDQFFSLLNQQTDSAIEKVDPRLDLLKRCLSRLKHADQNLLKQRYYEGVTIKDIAEHSDRSVSGLYKVMARVHQQLVKCMNYRLGEERRADGFA